MALTPQEEKAIPIWSHLYKLEGLRSRMYGYKSDVLAMLSEIICEEELEPLLEFQDYIDAAAVRIAWALQSAQVLAREVGLNIHAVAEDGKSVIPPQSGSSLTEGRGAGRPRKEK